jgi:hypothetical protein
MLLLFCTCKKELSFENGAVAEGFLVKDVNGDCMPISLKGNYQAGSPLTNSNAVIVSVHLKKPGSIRILSDTVNGYFFSYTGVLSDTGIVTIELKGHGKPLVEGINAFIIRLGSSECTTSIRVYDPSLPASYFLSATSNICINDSVYGVYVRGTATDTSNKIAVQLKVITPGSYNIHTDTVNGYSFSGKGILPNTGLQTIFLQAKGTPLQMGINTFTVKADSSTCTLTVIVFIQQLVTNPDLFPLTLASNWQYNGTIFPVTTTSRSIIDSLVVNGNLYKKMNEVLNSGGIKDLFFRKQGENYYEYGNAEKFTTTITFSPALYVDINFLKETMTAGLDWYSDLYTGHATFGQDVNLKYHYTCLEADVPVVVNNKAFLHVYKVSMVPQLAAAGITPGNTQEYYEFWYAKGIGLIYSNFFSFKINNWIVY